MPRREPQALGRHEIDVRVMQRWHGVVHGGHDLLVLMRARDGQHARMLLADAALFDAHATRDDDAAVLSHGFADGVEALALGGIEEPAGVHDHDVGSGVVGRDLVAFGAQLGDDALAIHKRLRAAERHEPDLRGGLAGAQACGRRG